MNIKTIIQIYLDKLAPMKKERWVFLILFMILYFLRIIVIQQFFLITYCVSIYLLHGLIEFLTPKEENIPDPFDNFEDDVYEQTTLDDEYRPFIRRMPEYKFWMFCMQLIGTAFMCTFFDFLDIPVYVPILIFYFIVIAALTAKNMHRHMKKYKYNPFFKAKDVYVSKK
ncbi:hypothetical protein EDEG_01145 [Edhazardia aedis USNM 41457]|uniref:Protein RER1 n=1 Tax=Edhazardia aedis (strain USNM 41457) TaxID=1003232 RepID=J9DAY6_EDHAE|nr:hypothetical protein EDEG_01145 [Edhazardia aedis USNM 41457]|eukprot:EJW04654.1 hypothetical protein EDEG_01145 [Edhazardia aedis USNM 41457]